jgi:hypothetical protein
MCKGVQAQVAATAQHWRIAGWSAGWSAYELTGSRNADTEHVSTRNLAATAVLVNRGYAAAMQQMC